MNTIDLKYSNLLSTRLDRYKITSYSPFKANFRCPICGDSQKSTHKARGWILEKDNTALYYCHNCSTSLSLRNFLKSFDMVMYNDYIVDLSLAKGYKQEEQNKQDIKPLDTLKMKAPKFRSSGSPLLTIKKISQLKNGHPAKKYIENRLIPGPKHYKLYYASKFSAWVNKIIPNKLSNQTREEPRLILPFIDKEGNLFGFQGRSFDPNTNLRYMTIMIDESMPKIFGLDTVDFNKKFYIVEGPIDSLFLNNAVAMAGADGSTRGLEHIHNGVFVFDNERRNKEIVSRMEKCIENGYKVCIWPENIIDKDINDMILSGLTTADIELIIDNNTYSGLEAKLKISYWRKC